MSVFVHMDGKMADNFILYMIMSGIDLQNRILGWCVLNFFKIFTVSCRLLVSLSYRNCFKFVMQIIIVRLTYFKSLLKILLL